MTGRSDSLNLAVATGVMLYEMYRQERQTAGRRERGHVT
jgi:tRNA G18 (ribose-2'-O)-methylase SpoU